MTTELFTALAKANATLKNPGKDGRGNYGAYLTLDTLLDHVRPVLAAQGLSITQDVIMEADRVQIVTQLHHASGESIVFGPLSGPPGQNWQQLGGAISYGRRYALLAALGMAGGDDDDAQAHTDANPKGYTVKHSGPLGKEEAKRKAGPSTDRQIAYIVKMMKQQGLNEVALNTLTTTVLGWEIPVGGLALLTFDQADALIPVLKNGVTEKPITRSSGPVADDPWAAPLIDPTTGEEAQ